MSRDEKSLKGESDPKHSQELDLTQVNKLLGQFSNNYRRFRFPGVSTLEIPDQVETSQDSKSVPLLKT